MRADQSPAARRTASFRPGVEAAHGLVRGACPGHRGAGAGAAVPRSPPGPAVPAGDPAARGRRRRATSPGGGSGMASRGRGAAGSVQTPARPAPGGGGRGNGTGGTGPTWGAAGDGAPSGSLPRPRRQRRQHQGPQQRGPGQPHEGTQAEVDRATGAATRAMRRQPADGRRPGAPAGPHGHRLHHRRATDQPAVGPGSGASTSAAGHPASSRPGLRPGRPPRPARHHLRRRGYDLDPAVPLTPPGGATGSGRGSGGGAAASCAEGARSGPAHVPRRALGPAGRQTRLRGRRPGRRVARTRCGRARPQGARIGRETCGAPGRGEGSRPARRSSSAAACRERRWRARRD